MASFSQLTGALLDVELNDQSTVLYTSARREQAINDAQDEFADLTECFIRQSSVACSCNVSEYNLLTSTGGSTDFIRLAKQGVEYHLTSSGGQLRTMAGDDEFPRRDIEWLNRFDPHWRESTSPVEFPSGYYLRADGGTLLIGLTQRPDVGSSETAKMLIPYVAKPAAMSASTNEPFSVGAETRIDLRGYHRALPHYAAYKLLPLIGDMQGAQDQLQKFMGYVTRYTQNTRPKGGTHVTMARSYFKESRRGSNGRGVNDPRFGERV